MAPVYVDAFTRPGRLLYRFDATLRNRGGTLDLFRDGWTGRAMQALWRGGVPSRTPDPNEAPSGADVRVVDRSTAGARFDYVFEPGHNHWHFLAAARYELLVPGGAARVADKIGFCLFDGLGESRFFPPWYQGSGSQTWCGFDHPQGTFTRMGLSPGLADRYRSQRHYQWVDVTDLAPGAYDLRAVANPAGYVVESERGNNVVIDRRTLPGVRLDDVEVAASPASPVTIELNATVVAPDVPARRSGACEPSETERDCYVWASEDRRVNIALQEAPDHGRLELRRATTDRQPSFVYTPEAGWSGEDRFTLVATDARGLTSRPATVTVRRPAPRSADGAPPAPPAPLAPLAPPDQGPAATSAPVPGEQIRPRARAGVTSARLVRRRLRWFAVLRLSTRARVRATVRRGTRGALVRRYRSRRLPAGTRRLAVGRLRRGDVVTVVVRAGKIRQRLALRRRAT